jgi:acyl-homoserine-lactone acylase
MSGHRAWRVSAWALVSATAWSIVACTTVPGEGPYLAAPSPGVVRITRTANGVAHIVAADPEMLAYGVAYAHAQDNVCQTAEGLVTTRGERSEYFGAKAMGQLGLRELPNEQIDLFVKAFIDDDAVARAAERSSPEANAMARGYVAGYNRYLADNAGSLPAACAGKAWVKPMTLAEYRRNGEIVAIQIGMGLFADALLGARPPSTKRSATGVGEVTLSAADLDMQAQPASSNAWAFGRDVTADGRGLLLGNPHFPWKGTNRFWQVHVTMPGSLDVMGVTIGSFPVVVIGFNRDVAWTHTVSTGKRFTLHQLTLVDGDPTSYLVDGRAEKMTSRTIGGVTLWNTRYGPVIQAPRMGLTWTDKVAFALQDANRHNTRGPDQWLQYGRARTVSDMRNALRNLGTPWVNTIGADRYGDVLYADASVVPDVDAAELERCTPDGVARRLQAVGLVVLEGSRSDCDWRRDPSSPVPGVTPIERLPVAVRTDWVMNSNDSFVYTNPAQRFEGISPIVGTARVESPRTRSSLIEIPAMLAAAAGGKARPGDIERQLFANHNLIAQQVLPDLVAACGSVSDAMADAPALRDGCAALRAWDRTDNVDSRGAHVFREFWRDAREVPNVYRQPFDLRRPVETPTGLNMADAMVATKVWQSLAAAVKRVRAAGFALDTPLGTVQRPGIVDDPVPLHGGEPFEGVLNMASVDNGSGGLTPGGYRVDFGTSYVQVVGFDERGPRAEALLTYGQSSDRASPRASDQLRLFSAKQWPRLPFHPEDVARERVGPMVELRR